MKFSLNVLKDEKAPAVALLLVLIKKYGHEIADRQPEFLRDEIQSDFGITLSDLQSDKIQAAITILTSDLFESQWEVFKTVCHLLNNTPDCFEDPTIIEAEEIATALAHYRILLGEETGVPFSDEVRAYAGLVFYQYGMSEAPAIFPQAIMPEYAVPADPSEKNQALNDLYDVRTKAIADYLQEIQA